MASARTIDAANSGTLTIGRDMTVSRLGFGAMRLTGPGIWGPPRDTHDARAVLRRAVALGVNLIDTADSYGPEVSEELIAEALYPYPEGLVIATKGGHVRTGPDQWKPNGRPEHLKQALEGSLHRLRLERIDLYQWHQPDPNVPLEDSIGALAELQRAGKIRHIGVCNVTTEQLGRARQVVEIVSVQKRYNLTYRDSASMVDTCTREGLVFVAWAPLASGQFPRVGGHINQIARRHGASPAQIVLAWLLHQSPVVLPIPGTCSTRHLEQNVAAAGIKLSQEDLDQISRSFAYWHLHALFMRGINRVGKHFSPR